ncbi:MAG TPA: response regulator transcription factor [Anaerolineales bacterium]|nr:response regulator transcription factor [Anaerolineales bacterium]
MNTTKTVLAIDDDIAITELLSIILRTHGFEALTANNSEDGLRLISEKSPDAITLDLMMPDIDGLEMCKRIRAISRTPILVLSAINDPAMVATVLDAGADDFIVKPVPSAVLIAHLNTLIRRSLGTGALEHNVTAKWLPGSAPLSS